MGKAKIHRRPSGQPVIEAAGQMDATSMQPQVMRTGIVEWFRPGEKKQVERTLADLKTLGVTDLRTGISWADWHAPGGEAWYDWLLPRLREEVNLLPCVLYTPPSLGIAPRSSSPPREPRLYADFLDMLVDRYGDCFEWVELWNEPNNLSEWDWTLDRDWQIFCEMIGAAAYWMKQRGKKTALAGMSPIDPNWMDLMGHKGVLQYIDAVGVHGFPGTWEQTWEGWGESVSRVRKVLEKHGSDAEVWITETGYSTWRHDVRGQLEAFLECMKAPVDRVYWYAMKDLDPQLPTVDGFHTDEREYHFGLKDAEGRPKLLYRMWAEEGVEGLSRLVRMTQPKPSNGNIRMAKRYALVTGGAGFIGTNVASRLLASGRRVMVLDSLSRPGVERNLRWLRSQYGDRVQVMLADVRDPFALRDALKGADQVFHFAAQVAVTTSLVGPTHDFEVNARGTVNLLEQMRQMDRPPSLVFTSTNKVYGSLPNVTLQENGTRYEPKDLKVRARGISEAQPLDFHSPYGCSKGTADQYVRDYARTFGLPAVVFRMSCIYGPHQHGTEDQGWVAHFLKRAMSDEKIVLYGDGKQVRDILFVEDLVEAMLTAQQKMDKVAGEAFNIGGGPENVTSLLELLEMIAELRGRKPEVEFHDWRPGDQRYYVSDTGKFKEMTGWSPRVSAREGVERLYEWLLEAQGASPAAPLVARKGA